MEDLALAVFVDRGEEPYALTRRCRQFAHTTLERLVYPRPDEQKACVRIAVKDDLRGLYRLEKALALPEVAQEQHGAVPALGVAHSEVRRAVRDDSDPLA